MYISIFLSWNIRYMTVTTEIAHTKFSLLLEDLYSFLRRHRCVVNTLLVVLLPCPAIVELLHYIYLNFKLVKLYFHLFMQTLLVMESARANIFTAATKPYLFTLKYRQKNRNTQFIFLCFQCNLV